MNITNNRKKNLTVILSVMLVAVIAVGATLAYLSSKTNPVSNVFTFAENIKGNLDEPSWNPHEALNLVPGKTIAKDPQITNTSSNGVTEYAAVKLTFQNGAGQKLSDADTAALLGLLGIDWSRSWSRKSGTETSAEQIYVYNLTLPQGVASDPVFYSVSVKDSITPAQILWLAGDYGHVDSCYKFGAHDGSVCTITYRHHEKCAVYGMTGAENTPKGGTLGTKTCDCKAAAVHEPACPSLIKTLTGSCGHNTVAAGLGNFTIKIEGAVVQADSFDTFNDAADALLGLFI